MTRIGDEKSIALLFAYSTAKGHRLCRSRRLIQKRSIGNLHTGQIHDHGLKIEQRLKAALRNFRLIGRVGGIPAWILQYLAQNDARRDAIIIPHADHRAMNRVLVRHGPQRAEHIFFPPSRRQVERLVGPQSRRDSLFDKPVQRFHADSLQHFVDIAIAWPYMTCHKILALFELRQHTVIVQHPLLPVWLVSRV